MPDSVVTARLDGLQLAPARSLTPQFLQPAAGIGRLGEITQAHEIAVRTIGEPVGSGPDDDVRVGDNDLLRIDLAAPTWDQIGSEIDSAGTLDQQAQVGPTESPATDFRGLDPGRGVHENDGFFFLKLSDAGIDQVDLLQVEVHHLLRPFFLAQEAAEQVGAGHGIFQRFLAIVDHDHWNANLVQLLEHAGFTRPFQAAEVEGHDVRVERDGLLDAELAAIRTAEFGDTFDIWEYLHIFGVCVAIKTAEVIAPTDDLVERISRLESRDDVDLAGLTEDDAFNRSLNRDRASGHVGQL